MRIELWALAEELLWQLHSAANQLKRRWQATEPALPHPPALAAWFAAVASLDEPRGHEPLSRRAVAGRRGGLVIIAAMELLATLLDFVLHIDVHLDDFVQAYGAWVYALLFAIIFVETGIVVMPFLPGDSLLFVVGAMCGVGLMNLPLAIVLLWIAAVLGDQCNYSIGRDIGPRVFQWEHSRWFNKNAFDQAHAFYESYGGITIVGARFLPFLRTFAPFVAGVAEMTRSKFSSLQRDRRPALGRLPDPRRLPVRQHPVGQGEPREDHLGRDPDSRRHRLHRRLAGEGEAAGQAGLSDARGLGPGGLERTV